MKGISLTWFDIVALALLVVGLVRGRRLGMSGELLLLAQWIAIVVGGAFGYGPLGAKLYQFLPIGQLWCNVIAYLAIAATVTTVFSVVKRRIGERLTSNELFGKGEYYLGMVSGCVRYALILIAITALINSRQYTQGELDASLKQSQANFGSDFFPRFGSINQTVMQKSMVGQQLNSHLAILLMKPTSGIGKPLTTADSPANRRNKELDSIAGK